MLDNELADETFIYLIKEYSSNRIFEYMFLTVMYSKVLCCVGIQSIPEKHLTEKHLTAWGGISATAGIPAATWFYRISRKSLTFTLQELP